MNRRIFLSLLSHCLALLSFGNLRLSRAEGVSKAKLPATDADLYDVIIIGAGAAGLNAARHLRHRKILCLEARDRVGGRVFSQPIGQGRAVELGAQWLAQKGQNRLHALIQKYQLRPQYHHKNGSDLFLSSNSSQKASPGALDLSYIAQIDSLRLSLKIKKMLRQISVAEPWRRPDLDRVSAFEWIQNSTWLDESAAYWINIVEQAMCCDPKNVSILEVFHNLATIGDLDLLEGAEHSYFPEGLSTVFQRMAMDLGEIVRTAEPVVAVSHQALEVQVATSKNTYRGRAVVFALPPQLMSKIELNSEDSLALPLNEMSALGEKTVTGDVVKMIAVYERPWWREAGLTGTVASRDGALQFLIDSSDETSNKGILVGLVAGRRAGELDGLSLEGKKQVFLSQVEKTLGRGPAPEQFYSHDWSQDEFARGGYASRRSLGDWTASRGLLQEPAGRLFFAGTERAHQWRGYIEGALESGERVAQGVENFLTRE